MKLPVPAMCRPDGIGASCELVQTDQNDLVLRKIVRRVGELQQLLAQRHLRSLSSSDPSPSTVEIKLQGGLLNQQVNISGVHFEVSDQHTLVILLCAHPAAVGTAITISGADLAPLLAEFKQAHASCVWCGWHLPTHANQCEVCRPVVPEAAAGSDAPLPA